MATTATATPAVLSPTATSTMNVTPAATPSTPVTDQQKQKKRKSTSGASAMGSAKKSKTGEDQEGRYCHHCHRQRESTVSCTLKVTTKKNKTERCGKSFCDACLTRTYGTSVASILAAGKTKDMTKALGHDSSDSYYFRCPICDKKCQCAVHRKKDEAAAKGDGGGGSGGGQSSAADLEKFAREAGIPVSEVAGLMNDSATRNKGKPKPVDVKKVQKPAPEKKQVTKKSNPKKDPAAPKEKTTTKDKMPKAPKPSKAKDAAPLVPHQTNTLKLVPVPPGPPLPLIRKPRHVDDPNFEWIAISYPLNIISARLRVREFVLRFEKKLNLIGKYVRIINDPNSEWTDLTYKNLITSMLKIMQSDKTPPHKMHPDAIFEAHKQIQSTSADNPLIWEITRNLMAEEVDLPEEMEGLSMEDIAKSEAHKLDLVGFLIELTTTTTTFRQLIEDGLNKQKLNHTRYLNEVKKLKEEWETQRQAFQKDRLLCPSSEKADLDARYSAAQLAHKQLMLQAEQKEWISNRKYSARTVPLGVDTLGNVYWQFHQRDLREEDWGQWIVIEKGPGLPHPSGVIPPPPSMPSDSGIDPDMPELPQPDDEETIRERVWYAVSDPEEIRHLADWIRFKGETRIYWQEMAKQQRPLTPGPSVPASPSPALNGSPSRHVMEAVRVPANKEEKVVKKEDFMPLVEKLRKIATYMEVANVV